MVRMTTTLQRWDHELNIYCKNHLFRNWRVIHF